MVKSIAKPAPISAISRMAALAKTVVTGEPVDPVIAEPAVITVETVQLINQFFEDTDKNQRAATDTDNSLIVDNYDQGKRYTLTDEQIDMLSNRLQKYVDELTADHMKSMLS